jgi:magnesium transporter
MLRIFKKRSAQKKGLPPGTPVYVGEERSRKARIDIIDYDAEHLEEKQVGDLGDCFPYKQTPTVSWINFDGIHDAELVEDVGRQYDLHPLVLEDIVNSGQRPKLDDHGAYLFLSFKMLSRNTGGEVDAEQVSIVLGSNYVLSFQEKPGDVFEQVRERIRQSKGRVRLQGPDYLAYSLIDAVVDNYFMVLEGLSDRIESLEEVLVGRPAPAVLAEIHRMKKELVYLRKAVWPLREAIAALARAESELIREGTRAFLRDVHDHAIQVLEVLEAYRDVVSGMVDTYLSSVSNRMNEVMKVLTIIATIFIPVTFIAGIYGMNFEKMPELKTAWGYPAVWCVMLVTAGLMLAYFWRKRWIGGE